MIQHGFNGLYGFTRIL